MFHCAGLSGEFDEGGFGVDYDIYLSILELPADISGVDLQEGSLAMVQFHLGLALYEGLALLIFTNPLSLDVTGRHAQTHHVGCIGKDVQFMTNFCDSSSNSTFNEMLRYL